MHKPTCKELGLVLTKTAKNIVLWVKDTKHALRKIGGGFFVLAFIAGLCWMSGSDIEPVAYVLGLLSSAFLAAPSVADYLMPERKPIRDMTYEELLEFIPTTDPKEDWQGITTGWASERFLKEDPRLRYKAKFTEDGIQNEDFKEPWANGFPDSKAVGYYFDLFYNEGFIDRQILVSVDGGRVSLPLPDLESNRIDYKQYHLAQMHDQSDRLDDCINRAGLSVENRGE